ncbi:hypothetical protein K504DRAFT_496869 [Pleomassaria siparia CBS 279.74]|uniref:Uncharacterized protein n=1 Tax=Pleomassaria siparia CBS 279.74 TaxID=1314801 RepID=A0A6G1KQ41_9PLEO|nr:hypothetical protein K504DRAFT_496869 [Pleomassaria siparia CBS 279.74]
MYAQALILALAASASAMQQQAVAHPAHHAVAALAARITAAPVPRALVVRADDDACATSASSIEQGYPSATDKDLSSFLDAQTDSTFQVPSSLQKQYCTYEASAVGWFSSVYEPFQKSCSDLIPDSLELTTTLTTETWCAEATKNVAGPRQTQGAMAMFL